METYLFGCMVASVVSLLLLIWSNECEVNYENIVYLILTTALSWGMVAFYLAMLLFLLVASKEQVDRLYANLEDLSDKIDNIDGHSKRKQ